MITFALVAAEEFIGGADGVRAVGSQLQVSAVVQQDNVSALGFCDGALRRCSGVSWRSSRRQ